MKKNLAFLFLMTIFLAACAGTNSASLKDTSWELVSYGAIENPILALPDVEAVIAFGADGNLTGNAGCNHFFGSYKVSKDQLTVGPVGSTEMYCENAMDQEMAVLMLLNGTLTFESDGNTLTIFSEDGTSALHLAHVEN